MFHFWRMVFGVVACVSSSSLIVVLCILLCSYLGVRSFINNGTMVVTLKLWESYCRVRCRVVWLLSFINFHSDEIRFLFLEWEIAFAADVYVLCNFCNLQDDFLGSYYILHFLPCTFGHCSVRWLPVHLTHAGNLWQ